MPDGAPPSQGPKSPSSQRAQSGQFRAVSAARTSPLPEAPKAAVKDRLKDEAANQALNALSVAKEAFQGFQASNTYFKYKVAVGAMWVVLAMLSLVIACPGSDVPKNELGGQLVVTDVAGHPVYMIKNEGPYNWTGVAITVNGQYHMSVPRIPNQIPDNSLTLDPKRLLDAEGKPPPKDLRFTKIRVLTGQGDTEFTTH